MNCETCCGTGWSSGVYASNALPREAFKCSACNGTGKARERTTPIAGGMEGVVLLEGETCPKCGRPGVRLSTLESLAFLALGDDAEKTIVHSYTRRRKDAPPPNEMYEVTASFGGCRLP